MADKKISQLTASTTPLAGNEELPIVQSGTTKKTSIESVLTSVQPSGTVNGVLYLNGSKVATSGSGLLFDGTNLGVGTSSPSGKLDVSGGASDTGVYIRTTSSTTGVNSRLHLSTGVCDYIIQNQNNGGALNSILRFVNGTSGSQIAAFDYNGNFSIANGNLVIGTAGKGIDFSADGQAAGMTSELLDDYEEGTWTPTYVPTTGAFDVITYNALTYGRYTKIGNTVVVLGLIVTDAFTVGTAAGLLYIAGLPYTPATSASSAINYSTGFSTNNPNGGYTSSTRIYPTYKATANGNSANVLAGNLIDGAFKNYVIFQATYVV